MSFLNKVKKGWQQEMTQRLPFALMAYMAGILAFFCFVPNPYIIMILVLISGVLFFITRHRLFLSWISVILFGFFLGLGNIYVRAKLSGYQGLTHPLYQTQIEATVEENQLLLGKQILTLKDIRWVNPDLKLPRKVKIHFKKTDLILHTEDRVKVLASLYPLDENFSRGYTYQLKFAGIGATGIAEEIQLLSPASSSSFLFEIRHFIHQRLFQILPHTQAEVAAPLITGEQKLVSRDTYQIYRRSGIAHVLSVSGFHMALLATFLFFVVRGFLALFPKIVLYYNTKKLAALIAFMGTFLYLWISGFQVPSVRAFLMISFVFMGVWIERPVLSMHSLMVIAFFLLLSMPQMLLSISFQLSFMATVVLVAFCQYLNQKSWPKIIKTSIGFIGLNCVVFSSLIPFILYHFHQWMPYGIIGNMLFNTAFSFFIMPLLFLGCLMMPLGWDSPFFHMAGWGLEIVRFGAQKLSNLSHSEIIINDYSVSSLICISFGILIFCWMKTPLKLVGGILITIGILLGIWT